jgi:hypothetical protein
MPKAIIKINFNISNRNSKFHYTITKVNLTPTQQHPECTLECQLASSWSAKSKTAASLLKWRGYRGIIFFCQRFPGGGAG